jgi:hypothetical protein
MKNRKKGSGQYHEAHSLFSLQIKFLSGLQKQELNSGETIALNVLLVAASTAFIESVLSNLLLSLNNKSNSPVDLNTSIDVRTLALNIRHHQRKQITKGSFNTYRTIIKDFTGKQFDKFADPKSWLAVQRLFELRNHLLHGNNLGISQWYQIDAKKAEENRTSGTSHLRERTIEIEGMKDYQKYLFEQKLIDEANLPEDPRHVLNLHILQHFLKHAVDFADQVHTNINKSYNLPPIFTFDFSIEALRRELAEIKSS